MPTRRRARTSLNNRLGLERLELRAMMATCEGFVFQDTNGNSAFDAGESPVGADWEVYVDTNKNGALDLGEIKTLTDGAGHYRLEGLPDGDYPIRVVPQTGFQTDALALGTIVRNFDAVESGNENWSGLAWANGSLYATFCRSYGVNDNVMYRINPETGAAIGSAVPIPDEIGEITFDGTHFWGANWFRNSLIQFDFDGIEQQRLSFAGMVTNSVEWDGTNLRVLDKDAHVIYRIDPSGNILDSFSTPNENVGGLAFDGTNLWVNGRDTRGLYALNPATGAIERSFAYPDHFAYGLAASGNYLWQAETTHSDVFQYDLGYGGGQNVTIAGADVSGVDLAVFQTASISGRVFNDNDQDSSQDANDAGLAGWGVYIDRDNDNVLDALEPATVTDSLGNYNFTGLRPGTYTIALDIAGQRQPRWSQVAPAGDNHSVVASSGEAISGKDFANFLDRTTPVTANEWGTYQGGELSFQSGLAWRHYTGAELVAPTFAEANVIVANSTHGGYTDWRLSSKTEAEAASINGVGARMYAWDGNFFYWTSTTSSGKGGQQAWAAKLNSLVGGGGYFTVGSTMLLAEVRDTGLVIDDGAAGYSATGFSAKSASGAYQGDQSTAAAGTASKSATWAFSGLEAGATYKVDVTWKVANGAATNAPFTVLEGATVVGTRSLNQGVAPNDFTVGSSAWEGLGTYTLSGNTLSVKLSNQANGTVLADAVRIFKILPSYAPPAPLFAASLPPGELVAETITSADVQPLLDEALRRWEGAGADTTALDAIDVQVVDLGGATLGMASGNTLWLDDNASGWGWFVDTTPGDDSEFVLPENRGERDRMDLLTVVMHELGHLLGHDHDEVGVMAETLAAGVRRTEFDHDEVSRVDQVLGQAGVPHDLTWLGAWLSEQLDSTYRRVKG